jgi:hypothetical protein
LPGISSWSSIFVGPSLSSAAVGGDEMRHFMGGHFDCLTRPCHFIDEDRNDPAVDVDLRPGLDSPSPSPAAGRPAAAAVVDSSPPGAQRAVVAEDGCIRPAQMPSLRCWAGLAGLVAIFLTQWLTTEQAKADSYTFSETISSASVFIQALLLPKQHDVCVA